MSYDTMPCGCEGHADNERLCRYPALEKQLAAVKARAEQAERERDEAVEKATHIREARDEYARLLNAEEVARERAERERDEACEYWKAEIAARERAEADNAALVRGIHAFHEAWKSGRDTLALVALLRLAHGDHPGAALLEKSERRRQLLEDVAKACRGLGPVTPEVETILGRVLERLQALERVCQGLIAGEDILTLCDEARVALALEEKP